MFDKRCATLDPIAIVAVHDAVHIAHFRRMDMTADHTVCAPSARFFDDRVLELRDVLNRVFYFVFQVRRQRPIREAQGLADMVEPHIDGNRRVVGIVTQEREPLGVFDDAVEPVSMQD